MMSETGMVDVDANVETAPVTAVAVSGEKCRKSIMFPILDSHFVGMNGDKASYNLCRKDLLAKCDKALKEAGYVVSMNFLSSYYQMHRLKMQKGSEYLHHKYKSKKATAPITEATTPTETKVEEVKVEEVPTINQIPEDAKWQAVCGEVTEYFKNRQQATAFVTKNGGSEKWNVSKIGE